MCNYSSLSSHVDKTFDIILKGGEEWGVCKKNFEKKIWAWGILVCKVKVYIFSREKERKERKSVRRVSVSSSGFQPRVREVRRWATSVVSPPNFRKIFNILSSMSVDNPEHPKNRQTSIEGVRSASTVKRALQRPSTREESIRSRASCGWSAETRYTMWLHCND